MPTVYLSLMAASRLENLSDVQCLGDASSGEVYLARENDTGGLYVSALKVIPKRQLSGTLLATESVMAKHNLLFDLRRNLSFFRYGLLSRQQKSLLVLGNCS
jgi:hypothetical protein